VAVDLLFSDPRADGIIIGAFDTLLNGLLWQGHDASTPPR